MAPDLRFPPHKGDSMEDPKFLMKISTAVLTSITLGVFAVCPGCNSRVPYDRERGPVGGNHGRIPDGRTCSTSEISPSVTCVAKT